MIAHLSVADSVPQIKRQIDWLWEYLNQHDGWFDMSLHHFYFTKWTHYIGLALENDWKIKQNKINDLIFRSLLILNKANRF